MGLGGHPARLVLLGLLGGEHLLGGQHAVGGAGLGEPAGGVVAQVQRAGQVRLRLVNAIGEDKSGLIARLGDDQGWAVLAAYAARREEGKGKREEVGELGEFLDREVFKDTPGETLAPEADGVAGFNAYAANFKEAIHA